jgi:hypothetical protein
MPMTPTLDQNRPLFNENEGSDNGYDPRPVKIAVKRQQPGDESPGRDGQYQGSDRQMARLVL